MGIADPRISPESIPVGDGIAVKGQFRLVVSLVNPATGEERGDFIESDAFDFLTVDEKAGAMRLPMVKLRFKLIDYDALSYINQGNILRVFITSESHREGQWEEEDGLLADFSLLKPEISSDGNIKKVTLSDESSFHLFQLPCSSDAMAGFHPTETGALLARSC